jgi:hypothetical protein
MPTDGGVVVADRSGGHTCTAACGPESRADRGLEIWRRGRPPSRPGSDRLRPRRTRGWHRSHRSRRQLLTKIGCGGVDHVGGADRSQDSLLLSAADHVASWTPSAGCCWNAPGTPSAAAATFSAAAARSGRSPSGPARSRVSTRVTCATGPSPRCASTPPTWSPAPRHELTFRNDAVAFSRGMRRPVAIGAESTIARRRRTTRRRSLSPRPQEVQKKGARKSARIAYELPSDEQAFAAAGTKSLQM